jgi:hypothetical protein
MSRSSLAVALCFFFAAADSRGGIITTELFAVKKSDSQVYALKFDTAGQPVGGYTLATTGQVLSISATRDGSGNPFLFAVGTDNQVYTLQFDASGNPVGKLSLPQPARSKASPPRAALPATLFS